MLNPSLSSESLAFSFETTLSISIFVEGSRKIELGIPLSKKSLKCLSERPIFSAKFGPTFVKNSLKPSAMFSFPVIFLLSFMKYFRLWLWLCLFVHYIV